MKIRFAVTPPAAAMSPAAFPQYLERCERLGFDTLWLSDIPLGPLGDPLFSLAYAAAKTTRLKLGANVVPLGRNPWWLAKQLAQLDQMSGGRVLLSFVPGLGSASERAALGHQTGDRGRAVDEIIGLLRQWWAGASVTAHFQTWQYQGVTLHATPQQNPLEIWLGGIGPSALERVAKLADGWLTAAATPPEAAAGRATIETHALACGRRVDPEHFGISIPYAETTPPESALSALRERRADRSLIDILAIGTPALGDLVRAHVDGGLSKFVLRSVTPHADWAAELERLADCVLPLQT